MVGAFDERQPRDDLRRAVGLQRDPPRGALEVAETSARSPLRLATASTAAGALKCET